GTAGGGFARRLELGASGLLIAGGATGGAKTCADVFIVALDPVTGMPTWSKTFDGSFVAFTCASDPEPGGGPPPDNDELTALTTDSRGRVYVALALIDSTGDGARLSTTVRRLVPH